MEVPGSTSSCGTYPEIARISFAETRAPSTRTVPRAAWPLGVRPARKSRSVDLPAPDGPRIANTPDRGELERLPERLRASSGASTEDGRLGRLGPGPAWPETPRKIFFTTPPGLAAVTAVAYTRTFSQLTTGRARAEDEGAPESLAGSSAEDEATRSPRDPLARGSSDKISGSPGLAGRRRARCGPSTALGVLACLLGACSPPARSAATRSNAAAAGTEYSERLSSLTYHAAAAMSATATDAMTIRVMRSPVQNSGGVNVAGHALCRKSSCPDPPGPVPASSYTQFPTSHVTAKDGMTPGWFQ